MRMLTPCTDTNDAICGCNYGYYMNETTGRCEHCTSCPPGHGMLNQCDHSSDTVCEVCPEDTFSETESMLDPCLPCTICDDEPPLESCTPMRDTVCYEGKSSVRNRLGPTMKSWARTLGCFKVGDARRA